MIELRPRSLARLAAVLCAALLAACAGMTGPVGETEPATSSAPLRYTVIIDAGSSGTRAHVFSSRWSAGAKLPTITRVAERGGFRPVSDMASDADGVKQNFVGLVSFVADSIPASERSRARVHLLATAGMRLLPRSTQDLIYAELRPFLAANSPFAIEELRTIEGTEEAVFGWLSVNYLTGMLKREGLFPTLGALDLGGASTQITFLPLDYPDRHRLDVTLGEDTYALYAVSYLGLGQNEAFDRLATQACLQNGYQLKDVTGTGDYDRCKADVLQGLENKKYCIPDKECLDPGDVQPPLFGDFIAFSSFYYVSDFYQLGQRWSLNELERAGRASCSIPWSELTALNDIPEKYLNKYCFAAAYVVALLNHEYGFSMDTPALISTNDLQGNSIGWTLGALVHLLASGDRQ